MTKELLSLSIARASNKSRVARKCLRRPVKQQELYKFILNIQKNIFYITINDKPINSPHFDPPIT